MEKEENQNNAPTDENQNLEKETEKPEESSAAENKQETQEEIIWELRSMLSHRLLLEKH